METRYYFKNGHYMKLDIDYDTDYFNPRKEYDHISTIYAWNRDWTRWYSIGDMTTARDMWDALYDVISDRMTTAQVIRYVKSGETSLSLKYDRQCREWDLNNGAGLLVSASDIEAIYDDIIYYMSFTDISKMLSDKADVILVPLRVFDYGCNRIKEAWNERDGMLSGFQMISKQDVIGCFGKDKGWKERAYKIMEEELKEFDWYLQGLVYYAIFSQFDWNSREFYEVETVYDFFTDLYGDDLFKYIGETDNEMFSDFETLYKHIA